MLIGFAGFAGAGKTTAIAHLVAQKYGIRHYAGSTLVDEITRRGIPLTSDNERMIREELRTTYGMAVFAERALPALQACMRDAHVLIDAVYCPEERDCYHNAFGEEFIILAVDASFDVRAARLIERPFRPITRDKLVSRDLLEIRRFRLGDLLDNTPYKLLNEGDLGEFEQALNSFLLQLG